MEADRLEMLELEIARLKRRVDILTGRLQGHMREDKEIPPEYPADFEEFYLAFPRKANKKEALQAWRDTEDQRPPFGVLLNHTKAFAEAMAKERRDKKYIPHPSSWLRRHGWSEDESAVAPPRSVGAPVPIRPQVLVNQQAPDWAHHPRWLGYVADVMDRRTVLPFQEWLGQ